MIIKVLKISAALVIVSQSICGQNLVRNFSFEEGAESTCDFMVWASFYDHFVFDWTCPTGGTSDIFSKDIPNQYCLAAMPGQAWPSVHRVGSQLPRSGSRFAGFYTYNATDYREYLQTELKTPLIKGEYYCVELYVSLADKVPYASNNIGVYFYDEFMREFGFSSVLQVTPQILETAVIQDSINWVKISGAFKAAGDFKYLSIGNFFTSANTQSILQPGRGPTYVGRSYYFIDDVSVVHLLQKIFTISGVTTICEGESTTVTAYGDLENIVWSTLTDTMSILQQGRILSIKPNITTKYRVTGTNCKLVVKDTIEIIVLPFTQPNLGRDTTICVGTTLFLQVGSNYTEYAWQDNSANSNFTVGQPGTYFVNVKNEFDCRGYDEIKVSEMGPPEVNLGDEAIICDRNLKLNAGSGELSYEWSTGASDSTIEVSKAGEYWVTVENRCGINSDTITLFSFQDIFIPNVLTLNNDGKNEKFIILGLSPNSKPLLTVINRWGSEVASRYNYIGDWPNDQEQVLLPMGIYFYTLTFPGCKTYKGWIHILR